MRSKMSIWRDIKMSQRERECRIVELYNGNIWYLYKWYNLLMPRYEQ